MNENNLNGALMDWINRQTDDSRKDLLTKVIQELLQHNTQTPLVQAIRDILQGHQNLYNQKSIIENINKELGIQKIGR